MNRSATLTRLIALMLPALLTAHGQQMDKDVPQLPSAVELAGKPVGGGQRIRLFILSGQSNMVALRHQIYVIPHLEKAFPSDSLIFVKHSRNGQPISRWYKNWQPVGDWKSHNPRFAPGNNDLLK